MQPSETYRIVSGRDCLYNIVAIGNVPSIMERGILCHNRALMLDHYDISIGDVQDIRESVVVDFKNHRMLHEYANLYFDARNPMMYKRSRINCWHHQLCVLHVSLSVLDMPTTVISDFNAASTSLARFMDPSEVASLPFKEIFAEDWRHSDPRALRRHRARKCAEVLVYEKVPPECIVGITVCDVGLAQNQAIASATVPVSVNPHLFFLD